MDRGSFFSALLGGLVVAVVLAALPAVAGDGDPMYVGQKNAGKTVTRLNTRGGLRIDNFKTGNPALILNTVDNTPPMEVSSRGRVRNLNADLLDGKHAVHFAGADEGLMGDWYGLANGQSVVLFDNDSYRLTMKCRYDPGSSGQPPPSYRLVFTLTAESGTGWAKYRRGTVGESEYMYEGHELVWNVATSFGVNIDEIYLLAINSDLTLLRVEGVGWADVPGAACFAALQIVPFPDPL